MSFVVVERLFCIVITLALLVSKRVVVYLIGTASAGRSEVWWRCADDRSARARPACEEFLKRFERDVDPDGQVVT